MHSQRKRRLNSAATVDFGQRLQCECHATAISAAEIVCCLYGLEPQKTEGTIGKINGAAQRPGVSPTKWQVRVHSTAQADPLAHWLSPLLLLLYLIVTPIQFIFDILAWFGCGCSSQKAVHRDRRTKQTKEWSREQQKREWEREGRGGENNLSQS